MPALENTRHERFAQELAKGKTADEAYQDAGYKANRGNAATLKANQNIQERVAELQERAAVRCEVSVASITESLLRIAKQAEALKDAPGMSVARASYMDAAKLNGLVIDKAQVETNGEVHVLSAEPVSEEEWAASYGATDLGAAAGASSSTH